VNTLEALIEAARNAAEGTEARAAVAEALAALEGVEPGELLDAVLDRFSEVRGTDNPDVDLLETLADVAEGVRLHMAAVDEAVAERDARIADLEARLQPPAAETDPPTDPATDPPAEPADPADPPATEPPAADPPADPPAPAEQPAEPEAVTASARRRIDLSRVRRAAPPAPREDQQMAVDILVASTNLPGFESGNRLDMQGLTAAVTSRFSTFPQERIPNTYMRNPIAQIRMPFPQDLTQDDNQRRDQELLDHAGDMARLDGGLVAAGGWCAPSETLYDLCPGLESNSGLVNVPEIQINRGGIRTTEGPDFAALYAGAAISQTEAQNIAGDVKPCYRVPCPSFTDTRAGVKGICIVAGILQDDAYPELTTRVVEGALVAHAHRFNADTLTAMETQSTAVAGFTGSGPSATTSMLNGLEMQIIDYRYRYRAPESLLLEVVLPMWVRGVIRSDLALRSGIPFDQVTDQVIGGYFNARGANVQWVYDWQDAFATGTGFGAATAATSWPDTVKALIYAAGAFVRGRGALISMEGIYDTTNLAVNDFTRLFTEEKFLVKRRCYQSRLVTFNIPVNGITAAPALLDGDSAVAA
jgi:hypothetical protein